MFVPAHARVMAARYHPTPKDKSFLVRFFKKEPLPSYPRRERLPSQAPRAKAQASAGAGDRWTQVLIVSSPPSAAPRLSMIAGMACQWKKRTMRDGPGGFSSI
jgi:hypothetical protein